MKKGCLKCGQQGMTLIEMLIAMVLGTMLLAGVMQIFLGSKQTYRMQDNLSRMQENGRFAMEFISRDIRGADHKECFSDDVNNSVGGEVFGSNDLGLNNSDRITVLQKDDVCGAVDVFSAISYFIQNANGQPALHRVTLQAGATPATVVAATGLINTEVTNADANDALIEGIENMQILYGEDTDAAGTLGRGTPNHYVAAGTTGFDIDEVVSVRISLLVRSIDNSLTSAPIAYVFNGVSITPGDRRLRRVFTSTIVLRNRL